MSVFFRVDINIVGMVLLGLIFTIAFRRLDKQDLLNKMFLKLSLIIMLQLFFETVTCVINRRPELWLIPLSNVLHICLYSVATFLTYCWLILIKNILITGRKSFTKTDKLLFLPVVINLVITLLSPKYKLVFYISESNVYHRGAFFVVSSVITYSYLLYGLVLILINKRKMLKQDFILFHVFAVLPLIGGLIQTLFYGVLLMWSSVAFSLIILFIFLQQRMIQIDDLTGAWNRSSFDYYIAKKLQQNGIKMGMIYVDIDGLKQINDEYGHLEGDYAIKTIIQMIRSVIRKSDVIVRMGGDEFIVIMENASHEILEHTIRRIKACLDGYNKKGEKSYRLMCSFGADVLSSGSDSIEQFLRHIDDLMYQDKKMK